MRKIHEYVKDENIPQRATDTLVSPLFLIVFYIDILIYLWYNICIK